MPSLLFRWVTTLAINILELVALTAWAVWGNEPAGRLLTFWVWFLAVVFVLASLAPARSTRPLKIRLLSFICGCQTVLLIAGLVSFGHAALATAATVAALAAAYVQSQYDDDGFPLDRGAA